MPEYPTHNLDELLRAIGAAGKRLSDIDAAEGAAGNISVCVRASLNWKERFLDEEEVALPLPVPELAGAAFFVTGSGTRLRDLQGDPEGNLGCLVVQPGGERAVLYASPRRRFTKPTSEFGSHLAVHHDRFPQGETGLHVIVHVQPPHLTYLSHIPAYQEASFLNRHLLRWQPETIIQMPEGLGVLPFFVPGSVQLAKATRETMRGHRLAVWSGHGVIARADDSVMHACDLIEYAETAARYEYLNLAAGEPSQGLSPEQIRSICESAAVQQSIF
jgi:rhamnulose-1-phosphate aldolase